MRIAYIITRSDAIGGALVHVRDFSIAMQRCGHDVIVLTGGTGPFTDQLSHHGIRYVALRWLRRPLNPWADLCALREIRRTLAEVAPDLVSTHSAKAGWLGRLAAWSLGIPVIFTAHGWAFTDGIPKGAAFVYKWAERIAARFADRIITVSEYDRDLALDSRIASTDKIVAVHNGMPDVGPELYAKPDRTPPHLIMVARFEEQKDHTTLLHALGRLLDREWTLELIGDGPLQASARALADRLGLTERIFFAGARNDVAERMRDAQIFLLISNWEGFPRSILEAMRAGLPVLASAVGGVTESVLEGVNGMTVRRGDVESLCEKLAMLLDAPGLRARLGAEGRARYERLFTIERMLDKTVGLYGQVTSGRAHRDVPATLPAPASAVHFPPSSNRIGLTSSSSSS